jgi:hypothetical protein
MVLGIPEIACSACFSIPSKTGLNYIHVKAFYPLYIEYVTKEGF